MRVARTALLALIATAIGPGTAAAQLTAASLSGSVLDEQQSVVPGATITLKHVDTDHTRTTTSDQSGHFRFTSLPPGRYEMAVDLSGFARELMTDMVLGMNQDAGVKVTMRIGSLAESVTVTANVSLIETSKTALARTVTTKQIDELPVFARDFTNLALLTPGIQTNQISTGSGTGIATAGQTGRNNTFLLDGLTLDDTQLSNARGGVSIDTVREFVVASNGFSAEFGQAAGAIVSALTRSGTNQPTARGYYYHRDDRWDATPAAARLVEPPVEQSRLEQKIVGGFVGGPMRRDRSFFFSSVEHTLLDTEAIVTSPVLHVFRPGDPTHVPVTTRNPKVLARSDTNVTRSNTLTARYRLDGTAIENRFGPTDLGRSAPERAMHGVDRAQDAAVLDNHVFSVRVLNEFRFQFARRHSDQGPYERCARCPAEERPSISLGKNPGIPNDRMEDRWQAMDAFTYLRSGALGEHVFKAGVDTSVIGVDWQQLDNRDGTFRFNDDRPFDPADPTTYPAQYTRTDGEPLVQLHHNVYAVFLQDHWKPLPNLTADLGIRWDYDDAPGISRDKRDVGPRIGIAFDPWKDGRTSIRGGVGRYFDQVPLTVSRNAAQAGTSVQQLARDPGYPDPFGPNPRRANSARAQPSSTTRLTDDMRTPDTEQISVGLQRVLTPRLAVTADAVWARGRHLLVTHDLNYPDLTDPDRLRPNPDFQRILAVETRGNSWYRGLAVGVERQHADRYSYVIAYTWSRADRDTDEFSFIPQDQRDFAAERGPSPNDVRHRLAASLNIDLPYGLRLATVITARSALPYNITTGRDDNGDDNFNDRPSGVGRNSGSGGDLWQADVRLSKSLRFATHRIELLAEAFNAANRSNWTAYDGRRTSKSFGKPTDSATPRQVQLGIRVDF
jgi:hypothetical protein